MMPVLDETFALVLRQRNVARDGMTYAIQQRDEANSFARNILKAWMLDLQERFKLEREVLRLQKKTGQYSPIASSIRAVSDLPQ